MCPKSQTCNNKTALCDENQCPMAASLPKEKLINLLPIRQQLWAIASAIRSQSLAGEYQVNSHLLNLTTKNSIHHPVVLSIFPFDSDWEVFQSNACYQENTSTP